MRFLVLLVLCLPIYAFASEPGTKPRVLVLSDSPPLDATSSGENYGPAHLRSDPDDVQADFARRALPARDPRYRVVIMTDMTHDDGNSLIRYLYYSPGFDTEAIIVTPQLPDYTHDSDAPWKKAQAILSAYQSEREQLAKHDPRFPKYEELARVTRRGRGALPIIWLTETRKFSGDIAGRHAESTWGEIRFHDWIGDGNTPNGEPKDSEGSEFLQEIFAKDDPRPIFVQLWGGPITLVQALERFQQRQGPDKFRELLGKLHIYSIHLQDITCEYFVSLEAVRQTKCAHFGETRSTFTGEPVSPRAFVFDMGHFWRYIKAISPDKVHGHGALSKLYDGGGEGDTPAFLYLVSALRGLNDPLDPTQPSWGNRFYPLTNSTHIFHTCPGDKKDLERWIDDANRDFLARLQWSTTPPGKVNHAPSAVVNGIPGIGAVQLVARPGSEVELSASASQDAEGDALSFRWTQEEGPTAYRGRVALSDANTPKLKVLVPADLGTTPLHLLLEVRDSGTPQLVSYRRVLIRSMSTTGTGK